MSEIRARDIMSEPPVTISPGSDLQKAARIMLDRGVGSLIVVDEEGEAIGIMTDSDFSAKEGGVPFSTYRTPQLLGHWLGQEGTEEIYREARERRVEEMMVQPVHSVDAGASLREVLEVMMKHEVKHVPVVTDGRPVGMVTRHDLLRLVVGS